jgi:two-component system, NarL family, nitrate/nitrite response regulator NarL
VRAASRTRPDVVLLDLRMPGTSAPEVVRDLRARVPGTVVLLFTAAADPLLVRAAVDAGACGVVLKDATSDELVGAIRAAAAGQPLPGVAAAPAVGSARGRTALTDREVEVLRHVARGCSNADVAAEMGLALATVKFYLHSAMRKLGARNRVEAILRAGEQQLL